MHRRVHSTTRSRDGVRTFPALPFPHLLLTEVEWRQSVAAILFRECRMALHVAGAVVSCAVVSELIRMTDTVSDCPDRGDRLGPGRKT